MVLAKNLRLAYLASELMQRIDGVLEAMGEFYTHLLIKTLKTRLRSF